jgi:hypothetical protein
MGGGKHSFKGKVYSEVRRMGIMMEVYAIFWGICHFMSDRSGVENT